MIVVLFSSLRSAVNWEKRATCGLYASDHLVPVHPVPAETYSRRQVPASAMTHFVRRPGSNAASDADHIRPIDAPGAPRPEGGRGRALVRGTCWQTGHDHRPRTRAPLAGSGSRPRWVMVPWRGPRSRCQSGFKQPSGQGRAHQEACPGLPPGPPLVARHGRLI